MVWYPNARNRTDPTLSYPLVHPPIGCFLFCVFFTPTFTLSLLPFSYTASSAPIVQSAPLSVSSSSAPAPHPRLSNTAVHAERPAFFGALWNAAGSAGRSGGGSASSRGPGVGGGHWGGSGAGWGGERQTRRHTNAGDEIGHESAVSIWRSATRDGDSAGKKNGGADGDNEEEEGFFQSLRRKLFEGDKQRDVEAKRQAAASAAASAAAFAAASAVAAEVNEEKAAEEGLVGGPIKEESPDPSMVTVASSEVPAALKFTPVRAAERSNNLAAPPAVANGGGNVSARQTPIRSAVGVRVSRSTRSPSGRPVASAAAGAGAGPGTGGYSPIITISPAHGSDTPPPNHPDAGAGGIRAVERTRAMSQPTVHMAPDMAAEAAAKFGLVRMVFGESQ